MLTRQFDLAQLYVTGTGVNRDLVESIFVVYFRRKNVGRKQATEQAIFRDDQDELPKVQ